MKYAFLVARREFIENAKTKGFWIGIFLFPIIIFLMIQVPLLLKEKATPIRYFVLVDQSGEFGPIARAALRRSHEKSVLAELQDYAGKHIVTPAPSRNLKDSLSPVAEAWDGKLPGLEPFISNGGKDFYLERLKPLLRPGAPAFVEPRHLYEEIKLPSGIRDDADLATIAQDLKPYLRGKRLPGNDGSPVELSAAILIPRDIAKRIVRPGKPGPAGISSSGIEYWSANVSALNSGPGAGLRGEIEQAINAEIRRKEFLARGMDEAAIRQVEHTYVPFNNLNPKKEKGGEAVDTGDIIKQWAPSAFVYLLWVAIFSIVQMLLNNIIEEKSNRIIEVLLSSVTPGELMMGKLMGIAAIGLTMLFAWMGSMFGILSWKAGGASAIAGQVLVVLKTSNLVPVFAVYFLLGYLLYAAIILSLGSVCNTIKEAQSYMGVITMVMMVPLMTMTYIPSDPNGIPARVLSWIPIYTPFAMMNRATADPPMIDLVGTLLLLILSTATALWMAGKIFRIGVLRTGQPPRIIELWRWVRG